MKFPLKETGRKRAAGGRMKGPGETKRRKKKKKKACQEDSMNVAKNRRSK